MAPSTIAAYTSEDDACVRARAERNAEENGGRFAVLYDGQKPWPWRVVRFDAGEPVPAQGTAAIGGGVVTYIAGRKPRPSEVAA